MARHNWLLLLIGLALACGPEPEVPQANAGYPLYDLTLAPGRSPEYSGSPLHLRVVRLKDDATVGRFDGPWISDSITLPKVVAHRDVYNVAWYLDLNQNGRCDPDGADQGWQGFEFGLAGGLTINVHPNEGYMPNVCEAFRSLIRTSGRPAGPQRADGPRNGPQPR